MSNNEIEEAINTLKNELKNLFTPYFDSSVKWDSLENELDDDISYSLANLLTLQMTLSLGDSSFCADSVIESQVMIDKNNVIKFWGYVYWLQTPPDYKVNKSGKDPFYCKFCSKEEDFSILQMSFGDYNLLNITKYHNWFELEMDWIWSFEQV